MMSNDHLVKSDYSQPQVLSVTPQYANWDYLSFSVNQLKEGASQIISTGSTEMALVPLEGEGTFSVDGQEWDVSRENVYTQMPRVLYVPPGKEITVKAGSQFEFAMGGAPAEGKYPVRLFEPDEQKVEVRGGGAAVREVHHTLAAPLPAERLILFEVYVPAGHWSGWPPHCHDRYEGSPYLEETYYYRINPRTGTAFHRNYRLDNDWNEIFPVKHGDCVLVTQGFHPVAADPGANVYFLNYLAGELLDEARAYKPLDDPNTTWILDDWEKDKMTLPIAFRS